MEYPSSYGNQSMTALGQLAEWDTVAADERERIARRVADALAPRFLFQGLELCTLGTQCHWIAMYTWQEIKFALLPGYTGLLGMDAGDVLDRARAEIVRAYPPDESEQHLSAWLQHLSRGLMPIRSVSLLPFLMQCVPTSLQVREPTPRGYRIQEGPTRQEIVTQAQAEGFDLASADEWEYACSGGARTLFRWGDSWLDAPWASKLRSEQGFPPAIVSWQEDQKPNAFGLTIAQDPWNLEYCKEPGAVRGGDGGRAASADAEPYFAQWLPLASAYRYPYEVDVMFMRLHPHLRRICSIPKDRDQ